MCSGPSRLVVMVLWITVSCTGCHQTEERVLEGQQVPMVTASGRLDALSETRLLVAERDAVIASVRVVEGIRVASGDLLIALRCDATTERLAAATAGLSAVEAELRRLESGSRPPDVRAAVARVNAERARSLSLSDQAQRARRLFADGVLSDRSITVHEQAEEAQVWQLKLAEAELALVEEGPRIEEVEVARANVEEAQARVGVAEAEARKCLLRAPVSGRVLRIYRREGEFSGASQGQQLIAIADTSRMIARAEIDERDAARVKVGMRAWVWLEGRPGRFPGEVIEVSGIMGRKTVRTLDPADRFDRETLEAVVQLVGEAVPRLVGLRVLVGIATDEPHADAT